MLKGGVKGKFTGPFALAVEAHTHPPGSREAQARQRDLLESPQLWYGPDEDPVLARSAVPHRGWELLCVSCAKNGSVCMRNHRKTCQRCEAGHVSCRPVCARTCNGRSFVNDS